MEQLNPVPAFGAKKNTSNIWRKIVTEFSVQKVSAPECWSGPGNRTRSVVKRSTDWANPAAVKNENENE